jgi:hypothetical protein
MEPEEEGQGQPEEFSVHTEESAWRSGAEIGAEERKEAVDNSLRFRIWPWIGPQLAHFYLR